MIYNAASACLAAEPDIDQSTIDVAYLQTNKYLEDTEILTGWGGTYTVAVDEDVVTVTYTAGTNGGTAGTYPPEEE